MANTETAGTPPGLNKVEAGIAAGAFLLTIVVGLMEFVFHVAEPVIFSLAAVGLIGLAWVLGEATDQLGHTVGPRASGIMNASFGNFPELVIVVLLIIGGSHEIAKASIIGSVLGNMLLVMGLAFFVGGLRNGPQTFTRTFASTHTTMLILGVVGLAVPTALFFDRSEASQHLHGISLMTAVVLLICYVAGLVFFLRDPRYIPVEKGAARWSRRLSTGLLAVSALSIAFCSEAFVTALKPTIEEWGLSEAFVGFILVPIVGNIAEHFVAVQIAWRNDIDFSMTVALGSSVQVAIAVAPLAVIASWVLSGFGVADKMDLHFDPVQMLVMTFAVFIISILTIDAESTWLEGLQLIAVYVIIAIAFWY